MSTRLSSRILLTGFEPFGGEATNPSMEIARRLHGLTIGRHTVEAALLPCVFGAARRELLRNVARHRPKVVICLGLAAGRRAVTPERVAINVDDARIPDNASRQPTDRPIVRGGPAAYWSTLPIKAIVAAIAARGVPAEVSSTAGTFVCNHVFYALMHHLATEPAARGVRGGFIHLPCADRPGEKRFSLPIDRLTEAIEVALRIAVAVRRDVSAPGGTVS